MPSGLEATAFARASDGLLAAATAWHGDARAGIAMTPPGGRVPR